MADPFDLCALMELILTQGFLNQIDLSLFHSYKRSLFQGPPQFDYFPWMPGLEQMQMKEQWRSSA